MLNNLVIIRVEVEVNSVNQVVYVEVPFILVDVMENTVAFLLVVINYVVEMDSVLVVISFIHDCKVRMDQVENQEV